MLSPRNSLKSSRSTLFLMRETTPREVHVDETPKTEELRPVTRLDEVLKKRKQQQLRARYSQRFFKKQKSNTTISFTGIVLVLPTVTVYVLEGSSEALNAFFIDLNQPPQVKCNLSATSNLSLHPHHSSSSFSISSSTMLPTFVDSASEHVTLIPMYRTQKLVYYEDDVNERWFSSMYFRGIMEMKKQDTVYPSADQELTMEDTQAWIEHMKEWAHHVGSLLPTVTTTTTSSTKLLPDPKPFDDVFSSTLSSSSSSLSPSPSLPTTTTTTTTAAATTSSINPGIYPSSSDPNLVIPKPETLGGVMKSPLIFSIQEWVEWMLGEVPYTTGIEDLFIWPAPKYTLFQVSPGE